MSELSRTIKNLRLKNWRTQKEIAAAVGLTQSGYAHIESGKNEPRTRIIQKLASFYRITIDEIINAGSLVS